MKVETFYFDSQKKWSISQFPDFDSEQTLILAFAAPGFERESAPIAEIAKRYPKSKMIGCSTAGEIENTKIMDDSITFAIMQFEKTKIQTIIKTLDGNQDSFAVGKSIVDELYQSDLKGIFLLSEGLSVNGSELAKGLNSRGDRQIVMTGGLAGDRERFEKTWSIYQGEIVSNAIVAVGFYGESIQLGFGHGGSWEAFGPERQITKSNKNILFQLDHKPALDLYKTYLGDKATGLPATGLLFPLGIRQNKTDGAPLVRTILGVNEAEKSLIFAGDVPEGYWARLMRTNSENLIQGAQLAAEQADNMRNPKISQKNSLSIAISCVGRRLILGERTEEEVESIFNVFQGGAKQIGFYSYGELSPRAGQSCELHNQTMTLTTLCECDEESI